MLGSNRFCLGVIVGLLCSASHSFGENLKIGDCIEQDLVTGSCVKNLILPVDQSKNTVDTCVKIGGIHDEFGNCNLDSEIAEKRPWEPAPIIGGLLDFVDQCEDQSKSTTKICGNSASLLQRARGLMDQFNDALGSQADVSPALACRNMDDAISSSAVNLRAWQQTCGQKLNECLGTCNANLIAVGGKPEYAARIRNAMKACNSFSNQREDAQRSLAMASSALDKSKLCQQQVGDNQNQAKRENRGDGTNFTSPVTNAIPSTSVSNLALPRPTVPVSVPVPSTSGRLSYTDRRDQASTASENGDSDRQGSIRRPSSKEAVTTTQAVVENEKKEKARATTGPKAMTDATVNLGAFGGNPSRPTTPTQQRAAAATADIYMGAIVPSGVSGQNAANYNIQGQAQTIQKGVESLQSTANVINRRFAVGGRLPANSYYNENMIRQAGIAGAHSDMFRNVHLRFWRLSGTFWQ